MARPNFEEKTFAGGSKTAKFVNIFSLESFLLYGTQIHASMCSIGDCVDVPTEPVSYESGDP